MALTTHLYHVDDHHVIRLRGEDFIHMVTDWAFEKLTYFLFYERIPSDEELIEFNQRGYTVRSMTANNIKAKQQLFASPLTTLQALSASMMIYYDDWDYLNQLIMTFQSFYRYPLVVMDNYESQLQQLISSERCMIESLPYFVSLMNLYSENGLSVATLAARCVASTQAEIPAGLSAAVGAASGPLSAKGLEFILPMLNEMNFANYKTVLIRMIEHRQPIHGFSSVNSLNDQKVLLAKTIATHLAEREERFLALLQLTELLEKELLEKIGFYPTIDLYAVLSLHFIGATPELFGIFFCFSRAIGWIAHMNEQRALNQVLSFEEHYATL
jgi:citrate synthase